MQGIGVVETEPTEEDNIVYTTIITTTVNTDPTPAPSTPVVPKKKGAKADEKADQIADPAPSLLKWQAAYKRWETSETKARFAIRLILIHTTTTSKQLGLYQLGIHCLHRNMPPPQLLPAACIDVFRPLCQPPANCWHCHA
ncbi:hypothetical protein TGAMA5MH_07911 [Trichoderma gamsii]|uniref:Uncharacterized protein n=1 Tax=Trichoderma gamsii TaxID=398673 RepID=A0A2K0T408_9HYPO|nr:hypothetical protein TGAMA5MH_07911 [Trichoderma gamsii]